MVTVLGISAAVWGIVMACAPILQIRRMLARRSSQDLSVGYFAVLLPGFALWVAYGLSRQDWALAIPNMVALTVGIITVAIALRLRRTSRRRQQARLTESMR